MLIRSVVSKLLQRVTPGNYKLAPVVSQCYKSTQVKPLENEADDAPVPYTTSPASAWKARYTRTGRKFERLWYEPYVVVASVALFMLYFFILREENDIDLELSDSLYSRIDGLEKKQLEITLDHNRRNGLETKSILERLQQLEQAEKVKE